MYIFLAESTCLDTVTGKIPCGAGTASRTFGALKPRNEKFAKTKSVY